MSLPRPTSNENLLAGVSELVDALERDVPRRIIGNSGEPAFQNGWANAGGGEAPAAFWKDVFGTVYLVGQVTSPAGAGTGNATVAFTLPDGYRPTQGTVRWASEGFSGAAVGVSRVVVATSGTVTLTINGVAANALVSTLILTGSFRADA